MDPKEIQRIQDHVLGKVKLGEDGKMTSAQRLQAATGFVAVMEGMKDFPGDLILATEIALSAVLGQPVHIKISGPWTGSL